MKHKAIRILLAIALLIAIGIVFYHREQIDADTIRLSIESYGLAAPLIFILLYALATVAFFPGAVLTLIGGAVFGPVLGTLYNLVGATIGATLAFLIARYLAGNWVTQRSGKALQEFQQGVEREGWRFVAFVRLVPLFPFNLLNYALGLTRISLTAYILASFVFMFPGAITYTYLGYTGSELVTGGEGVIQKLIIAFSLLAAAGFVPGMVKRMRNYRAKAESDD
jgi:uncharacterized membrane protein YdjX (TVP38/TMEM64 family)